jgi:hypothetical protein
MHTVLPLLSTYFIQFYIIQYRRQSQIFIDWLLFSWKSALRKQYLIRGANEFVSIFNIFIWFWWNSVEDNLCITALVTSRVFKNRRRKYRTLLMGIKMRLSLHVAIKLYGIFKVEQILVNCVHYVNVYISFSRTFLMSKTLNVTIYKAIFYFMWI